MLANSLYQYSSLCNRLEARLRHSPSSKKTPSMGIPYFLEISPHLELSPPSKSRRVIVTLNALNAALEFSPHVVKGRHYCAYIRTLY